LDSRTTRGLPGAAQVTGEPDSLPDPQGGVSTCANCAGQATDPALEGWHVFDDGLGEEHALCAECSRIAPD